MGIIELLTKIGEENCMVQSIPQNLSKCALRKGQAELTFVTDAQHMPDLFGVHKKMGLVVWMDMELFEKIMKD